MVSQSKEIREKILADNTKSSALEYMFSKALEECLTGTVKFIYKKHKIIKNKRKYYSIYRMDDGKKLYGPMKYQDMAKYIIDNIDNTHLIKRIFDKEYELSRYEDKIDFLKRQYISFKGDKSNVLTQLIMAIDGYKKVKKEFLIILGKHNIC